ncbi:MAG: hypothetical protein KJ970_03390 [Candidatus Eisenbacteria bacterium]|uniref:Uncharacterized protein n=1 Tax=Eiseniibacteriota bacterium TaxID=2212470 RepID=A0A948RS30_UNCEI|nr:hypothetical protein [Candidatus Eisenbacteria bacterium]MBU1949504.1 hypothetical protein [Candidatus Eisenbacteria bacterium]MBU2689945.1 hypothetical protein [Candidatus Eisenbacteria bacterium]
MKRFIPLLILAAFVMFGIGLGCSDTPPTQSQEPVEMPAFQTTVTEVRGTMWDVSLWEQSAIQATVKVIEADASTAAEAADQLRERFAERMLIEFGTFMIDRGALPQVPMTWGKIKIIFLPDSTKDDG